mgnify:CR=1 FL=1
MLFMANLVKMAIFRQYYDEFDPAIKVRELKRLNRLARGGKVIIGQSLKDRTKVYRFNSVYDIVNWLKKQGLDKATSANIYNNSTSNDSIGVATSDC